MMYVLICLCLSLAGVAGLQFMYLIYLERIDRDRKKSIYQLERRNKYLAYRLEDAEVELAEQKKQLDLLGADAEDDEEVWADVIEDR